MWQDVVGRLPWRNHNGLRLVDVGAKLVVPWPEGVDLSSKIIYQDT